jgi:hypothetical protein
MKHPRIRIAALTGLAALLLVAAGCKQTVSIPAHPTAEAKPRTAEAKPRTAASFVSTAQREVERQHMAVHALLATLIDSEGDTPHFTIEPDSPLICAEASTVRVNGAPLEPGAEVPLSAFLLDFELYGACPLGPSGPRLDGPLEMLVVHDDEFGLEPVVIARN